MQEFFRVLGKRLVWPVGIFAIAILLHEALDYTNPLVGLIRKAEIPLLIWFWGTIAWTVTQFVSKYIDSLAGDKALKNINVRAEEYKKLLDSGVINEIEYEVKMTELKEQALKKAP